MRTENKFARANNVPKAFRRYAKRYGNGVEMLVAMHKKTKDIGMLNHWQDKKDAAQKLLALMQQSRGKA